MAKEPTVQENTGSDTDARHSIAGMLFAALYLRRKLIMTLWIAAFIGSFIVAITAKKHYTSSVTFQIRSESSGPLGISEGLKMLGGKFNSNGTGIVLSVLDSRDLAVSIIKRFDLKKRYRTEWDHLAIKEFRRSLSYESFDEGIVQMSFTYSSADSSKLILDSILSFVNRKSIEFNTHKARQEFEFSKMQVDSVYARMDSVRIAWVGVMQKKGLAELEGNVELAMKTYGMLEQALMEIEGKLVLAKSDDRVSPQERRNLESQLAALKKKRDKLFSGGTGIPSRGGNSGQEYELSIAYDSIPALLAWQEEIKFLAERDKLILKALLPKQEQSRLSMVELMPVINVIDPSYVPPYKSGPKRAYIIVFGTVIFGTLLSLLVMAWELYRNPSFTFPHVKGLMQDVRRYG